MNKKRSRIRSTSTTRFAINSQDDEEKAQSEAARQSVT